MIKKKDLKRELKTELVQIAATRSTKEWVKSHGLSFTKIFEAGVRDLQKEIAKEEREERKKTPMAQTTDATATK